MINLKKSFFKKSKFMRTEKTTMTAQESTIAEGNVQSFCTDKYNVIRRFKREELRI